MNHRYLFATDPEGISALVKEITETNRIYVEPEFLARTPFLQQLFQPVERVTDFTDYLIRFLESLNERLTERSEDPDESLSERGQLAKEIEQEFIFHYFATVNRMREVMCDHAVEMRLDTFFRLLKRMADRVTIPFQGEPLSGLQIMGVLETRALSLLLIFHYSRNTDNVDALHLKKYTEKYITPFVGELPNEYSGYQQLEYLHCISLENKEDPFGQVLHDSYPFVFAFRGCMKSELEAVRPSWPAGVIVNSLYNSYYKLAAVDEAMLTSLLDDLGIEDAVMRSTLQALTESRPAPYDRKEMSYILGRISPDLVKLQDAWDTSLLRRSSLTLMGMYIAKICIRETIGEDFDLSHWM